MQQQMPGSDRESGSSALRPPGRRRTSPSTDAGAVRGAAACRPAARRPRPTCARVSPAQRSPAGIVAGDDAAGLDLGAGADIGARASAGCACRRARRRRSAISSTTSSSPSIHQPWMSTSRLERRAAPIVSRLVGGGSVPRRAPVADAAPADPCVARAPTACRRADPGDRVSARRSTNQSGKSASRGADSGPGASRPSSSAPRGQHDDRARRARCEDQPAAISQPSPTCGAEPDPVAAVERQDPEEPLRRRATRARSTPASCTGAPAATAARSAGAVDAALAPPS